MILCCKSGEYQQTQHIQKESHHDFHLTGFHVNHLYHAIYALNYRLAVLSGEGSYFDCI